MTCHVLHAGDGYTYLTRQVASDDVARSAQDPLVAYYQASGNPPGVWVGAGCGDLGMSGVVTEEHMLALYGEGLRPDANEFIAARIAGGDSYDTALTAARLGRKFYQFDNDIPLVADIRAAYATFEKAHHRRATVPERRDIKESVARSRWIAAHPDEPPPSTERVRRYLTDELGKARQPVAGFDLVFSPVKSVSVLWALGGHEIRRVVEQVHEQAWRSALAYGEREASDTRIGANGIAFASTSGFVATAFQHRDSRAGDPDLHTHMAVSNRVLAADGKWRTIDSRQLHKVAVSMSETYNSLIEQGLIDRLGVRFIDVDKSADKGADRGAGKRSVREIDGLPVEWITGFSSRRTQVEAGYDRLVADYVRQHGHTPPRSVQYQLAQQATLQDRPAKTELRTLAEQIEDWTRHAHDLLPGVDIPTRIGACLRRTDPTVGPELDQLAASVVARIADGRATWAVYHVRSEAHRQLRPFTAFFTTEVELLRAVETVTRIALDRHSLLLDVEVDDLPQLLRRHDHETDDHGVRDAAGDARGGESVFRRRGSRIYTAEAILAAEQRLVDDARTTRGAVVPDAVRDAAILRWQQDNDKILNPGQRALVAHFVSSGKALAVGIGPPGTGKSTTMAAMRAAWETTGGRVIGFAPSAAAASVLSDDLGVRADTLHSLTVARRNGAEVDVKPGDLLLVDEAGMAGTLTLDEVRALATERGAVVRLLGDYRQLTAVEAGGALRLIHHDVGGVELSEVRRFARPDEAKAVLQFRVGDQAAVDWYADNDRLVGGVGPAVLDRLYQDWKADIDAGRTAIMISDSNHVARELSARAQTERRAAGLVADQGVRLHDGTIAGVGDRVVTRLNRRKLTLFGGKDFVKNGDLWEVTERHDDGRLTVRHVQHGGMVRLSATYVALHVELGYAATIHRSQGLTVQISRAFLSAMAAREAALVALSRGTAGNYAYVDTEQVLNVDEPPVLPGDLFYRYRNTSVAEQALRAILARESAELSATEQHRNALEAPHRLDVVVPQYTYARQLHRGPDALREAEEWIRAAIPRYADDVVADEAWPELARVLHDARDAGVDPVGLLRARTGQRALHNDPTDPAESVAQVLHWRITQDMPTLDTGPHPDRPDLLPGWVPTPPRPDDDSRIPGNLAEIVELGTWLRDYAEQIAARVRDLGERIANQVAHHTTEQATQHATEQARGPDSAHLNEPVAGAPPEWAVHLGPVPDDPVVREQWIRRAGQVAAYRERWQIPDTDTELLPSLVGGRGERAQACVWVQAYLRDHPLEHAAADADQRHTHQREQWVSHATRAAEHHRHAQQQERDRDRRRDAMAALLRETWRHEPDLVELIIAAAAFDTVAGRLHDAAEAGYDLREVLAEIPSGVLRAIQAPHIQDPAAYTAAMVDIAVERIRSGDADRDAQHRAEQQRFAQMHDQVSDLLREAWETRPHLAETVIHAPAFTALVRALDRYTDAGLDARDLLAAIPLATLDAPNITDKDRFSVYLTHRIAQRELDALDQNRRAAHENADRIDRQRGAAAVLRHAWHQHPELADRVIHGPAFRFLADRMHTAQRDGHDVDAVLRDLDPVALTAAHVPSPSGAVTFAFSRAIHHHSGESRRTEPATSTALDAPKRDTHTVDPTTTPGPTPPAQTLPSPNRSDNSAGIPAVADGQRGAVAVSWTQRPHGRLTDAGLYARVHDEQRNVDRLARDHDVARQQAEQLRLAAEAGHGRHTRAVDDDLARVRDQADAVREADQLETRWRDARDRAGHAAEQRAHAQHELDRLGRLARTRRTELTQRVDQLRLAEDHAQREATELAQRAAVLHQQTGPREQRQRIQARAHQLEADYPQAREEALGRDRAAAQRAEHRTAQLLDQQRQHTRELEQLRTEQQLRERLPDAQRQLEHSERVATQPAPAHVDRHQGSPEMPDVEPITPELTQPEPISNELVGAEHAPVEPDIELPPSPHPGEPEP